MNPDRPLTLGDVLATPTRPGRDVHLFLPRDQHWTRGTPAIVVNFDEVDEDLEEVEQRTGFQYALPLSTIREIVENARQQRGHPTPQELVQAFLFYYDRDAFIDFDAVQQ